MFNFWKRQKGSDRLTGPKDIPNEVGGFLVVSLKQDPYRVWTLKAVIKPEGEKKKFLVRVYDPKMVNSKGVTIKNYNTFDECPEFILFSGWFSKDTHLAEAYIPPKVT